MCSKEPIWDHSVRYSREFVITVIVMTKFYCNSFANHVFTFLRNVIRANNVAHETKQFKIRDTMWLDFFLKYFFICFVFEGLFFVYPSRKSSFQLCKSDDNEKSMNVRVDWMKN